MDRDTDKTRLVSSGEKAGQTPVNPRDHPFVGMWKDREDMADPVAYVRKLRAPRYAHLFGDALPVATPRKKTVPKQRKAR